VRQTLIAYESGAAYQRSSLMAEIWRQASHGVSSGSAPAAALRGIVISWHSGVKRQPGASAHRSGKRRQNAARRRIRNGANRRHVAHGVRKLALRSYRQYNVTTAATCANVAIKRRRGAKSSKQNGGMAWRLWLMRGIKRLGDQHIVKSWLQRITRQKQ